MFRIICLLMGFTLLSLCAGAAVPSALPCSIPTVLVIEQSELIPLTPFAEIVGATLNENMLNGTVTLTRGEHTFTCAAAVKTAGVDGREVILPMAPIAQGDVLYVPLRPLVEALGGQEALDLDATKDSARVKLPDSAVVFKFPRQALHARTEMGSRVHEIFAANADGSGLRRLTYHLEDVQQLSLSPDGQSLLFCRAGNVLLRSLHSHQEILLHGADAPDGFCCSDCGFTPDGSTILMSGTGHGGDCAIARIGIDGQGFQPMVTQGTCVVGLPDGKQIAYAVYGGAQQTATLFLADPDGGNARQIAAAGASIFKINVSKNGALLAGAIQYFLPTGRGTDMWSTSAIFSYALTGEHAGTFYQRPAEKQHEGSLEFKEISPDGQYILYAVSGGQEYWVMRYDQTAARKLPDVPQKQSLRFAADSKALFYTTGDATYRMALDTLACTADPTAPPALLTPDGRYMLFTCIPGEE